VIKCSKSPYVNLQLIEEDVPEKPLQDRVSKTVFCLHYV
jgi:hypothetical protein